jgi:hypothetical protein
MSLPCHVARYLTPIIKIRTLIEAKTITTLLKIYEYSGSIRAKGIPKKLITGIINTPSKAVAIIKK